MKRNFLITTRIESTWEIHENNFLLGKWCEFYEFNFFDKEKFMKKNLKIKIIKSPDIWGNSEEKIKGYNYIKKNIRIFVGNNFREIIHNS